MQNLKDTVSTICGFVFVICTALLGVDTQIVLPKWVLTTCIIGIAISGALTMYLTGKNPNGTTKSPEQVVITNNLSSKP